MSKKRTSRNGLISGILEKEQKSFSTAIRKKQHSKDGILSRHPLLHSRIWDLDETGVTTVLKLNNIIASRGVKQIENAAPAEREELVTMAVAVSAHGTFILCKP